jgi:CRP-like cAMP-binding protein
MQATTQTTSLAQLLKTVPALSDLAESDLDWLAARMELIHYSPGDLVVEEGAAADRMFVILEGETRGQREKAIGDGRTYSSRAPHITGMLPYSRLTHIPLTIRAMTPTTIAILPASCFPEMLERLPAMGPKLVGILADRFRETT